MGEDDEHPDMCDSAVQEQLFNAADADDSGTASAQELADAFGMSEEEAQGFVHATDSNDDGEVSLDELRAFLDEHECNDEDGEDGEGGEEDDDMDMCNAADKDGSGKVSAQELVDAFDMPQEEADGFVAATDSNGDGEVSLEELQAFFAEVVCNDKATMKLKAHDDGHGTGGAMKKLKKKLKAETKIAEAHAHIDEMKDSKKKLKKKQKADEKREAAEKRKDD